MKKLLKKPVFVIVAVIVVVAAAALVYGLKIHGGSQKEYPEKITTIEQLNDAGKWSEAEKMARQVLDSNPGNDTKVDAYWELALAESSQGKYDNAVSHAKAIQTYDSVGSHYLLGLIYLDAKQLSQAKQELTQASKQDSIYKKDIDSLLSQLNGATK